MHVPINVKSPNNISEWRMGFNSAFKGLMGTFSVVFYCRNISHLCAVSLIFSIILDRDLQLTPASNYFVFQQCNFT